MDQNTLPLKFSKKYKNGQIVIEGLFFIVCVLSFLLAVQFFQSLARKEIQKERLSRNKIHTIKKASWFKPLKKEK